MELQKFDKNDPDLKEAVLQNLQKHHYVIEDQSYTQAVIVSPTNLTNLNGQSVFIDHLDCKGYTVSEFEQRISSAVQIPPPEDPLVVAAIPILAETLRMGLCIEQKRLLQFVCRSLTHLLVVHKDNKLFWEYSTKTDRGRDKDILKDAREREREQKDSKG